VVSKRKVVTRVLKKHQEFGRGIDGPWGSRYISCECGWEQNGNGHEELDDYMADHIYSKIKKALEKRSKIAKLYKE